MQENGNEAENSLIFELMILPIAKCFITKSTNKVITKRFITK